MINILVSDYVCISLKYYMSVLKTVCVSTSNFVLGHRPVLSGVWILVVTAAGFAWLYYHVFLCSLWQPVASQHSQVPATGLYPELDESHILLLQGRSSLILCSHLCLGLSLQVFRTKLCMYFILHTCSMSNQSHIPWFDNPNNIWWQVTVAARSEAWTVVARLVAGIMGSNPTQDVDVWCVYAFILCLCSMFR
jgi:hypothetical protein